MNMKNNIDREQMGCCKYSVSYAEKYIMAQLVVGSEVGF
jgi:hypothetical protein